MTRELVGTKKQDWGTPRDFFAARHALYDFTVDAAAAEYNACLPRWFGPGGEKPCGQATSWKDERVWCNPEYGKITFWLDHAERQMRSGCELAEFLLPANTDTAWFHKHAPRAHVSFIKGRLSFEDLTPPEVELQRLVAAWEQRPTKTLLVGMARLFNEDGWLTPELEQKPPPWLVTAAKALKELGSWPEKGREPGPGFPSMLLTFGVKPGFSFIGKDGKPV